MRGQIAILTLLLPLVALPAWGGPLFKDPLSRQLEETRRRSKPARPKLLPLTTRPKNAPITPLEDPLAVNACLENVCGPAVANLGAFDAHEGWRGETVDFRQLWTQTLRPRIREAVTAEGKSRTAMTARLERLLEDPAASLDPMHPMRAIWHYIELMQVIPGAARTALIPQVTTAGFKMSVNRDKLREALGEVSPEQFEAIALVTERVYAPLMSEMLSQQAAFMQNPLSVRLRMRYEALDPKEALKTDAATLLKAIDLIRAKMGPVQAYQVATTDDLALLERGRSGGDLDAFESAHYVELAAATESYSALLAPEMLEALRRLPFNPMGLMANLRRRGSPVPPAPTGEAFEARIAEIETACREPLNMALGMTASQLRLRQARAFIQDVTEASVAVATRLANPGTESVVEAQLRRASFALPDEAPVERRKVETGLARRLQRSAETFQALAKPDKDLDQLILYVAAMYLQGEEADGESTKNEPDELVEICSRFQLRTVTDATMTSSGRVMVSWFSVTHPTDGIGIVAHELGHLASHALRRASVLSTEPGAFIRTLNCVADRNPFYAVTAPLNPFQNSTWSEEDWADFFAAEVLHELQRRNSPWKDHARNFACALIVDTGSLYGKNVLEPHPQDPHSSGLLRLLTLQHDLRRPAPACEPLQKELGKRAGAPMTCRSN